MNRPITGMIAFGNGYLMVGEGGGIFDVSDQELYGSLGAKPPASAMVAMTAIDER